MYWGAWAEKPRLSTDLAKNGATSRSPWTTNTCWGLGDLTAWIQASRWSRSAWEERPWKFTIFAWTAISSPKSFTLSTPSSRLRPRVPSPW